MTIKTEEDHALLITEQELITLAGTDGAVGCQVADYHPNLATDGYPVAATARRHVIDGNSRTAHVTAEDGYPG